MADETPPKRTEKLQVMLDEHELEAIEEWRFRNRLPSRAAAIRTLISRGLEAGDLDREAGVQTSQGFRVVEPD
jgi:antitoxin component HigA of HigAB toxin-antitoxin module